MGLGIDEDWAKVNPDAAGGFDFIVGYESEDTTGKNLTVADIAAIHAAHKDVGIVYEFNPQSALLSAPEGHRTAAVAINHAQSVGAPKGVCLYNASFDFDVQPSQFSVCDAFLSAYISDVHSAGYRGGPYAGYGYIQHSGSLSLADFYWQTYGWSLDANGIVQWSPYAVLHQYANGVNVAGVLVDLDTSLALDWGQWKWNGRDNMQMLVKTAASGRVWLCDGMFRREVTNMVDAVGNNQTHQSGFLGNLSNNGQPYVLNVALENEDAAMNGWGVDVATLGGGSLKGALTVAGTISGTATVA